MSQNEAFPDREPMRPFEADVSGKEIALTLGNCAIALFRHRPNMDYLAVIKRDEGDEEESWTFCFDQHALIYWMGGLALTAYDRENVRRAENKLGSFYSRYGWNPDVIIEDYPNANELEVYIQYIEHGYKIPDTLAEELEGLEEDGS